MTYFEIISDMWRKCRFVLNIINQKIIETFESLEWFKNLF